ncbi:hypothetical protein [Nocardia sp. alder85J]|uniref:hypothetical protein n=1 Tax=Nocardia sp. alder85J TaxID=2862949 RepID=UPI001CD550C4|nr:hypothetical protein [Nocardia sp. alder85J]MCX4098122.1 hypothetical protein [Nocardia sp. alder85J]
MTDALHKILDSAAGEAGKRAWEALATLLGRHRSEPDATEEPVPVPETDSEIEDLANRLARIAAADPAAAERLRAWLDGIDGDPPGTTHNTISGTVQGHAIQARDISGPITFG